MKIVYKDKIVYVDKPIEKIVYIDAPTKTEAKVSNQKTNLLKELQDLKNKKKKTKKVSPMKRMAYLIERCDFW